jgi:hypothetical protein
MWEPGYIRAALLTAAARSSCPYVSLPFPATEHDRTAAHFAQLRDDFAFETFSPARWRATFYPKNGSLLLVCLYSIEEFRTAEAEMSRAVAS